MGKRISATLLVFIPMAFAALGGAWDERTRLGLTTWRAACRSAGFSPVAMLDFAWQLLPGTLLGLLAGGLVLQLVGFTHRHAPGMARCTLAAHAGCMAAMVPGMLLCVSGAPWLLGLSAELALAAAAAAAFQSVALRRVE